MYLYQNDDTGYWTELALSQHMTSMAAHLHNVHDPALCEDRGCAIHNHPSVHPLMNAPLNWRTDRGILERVCVHLVGHPDRDSAAYLESVGAGYENIHGCDGCCSSATEQFIETVEDDVIVWARWDK